MTKQAAAFLLFGLLGLSPGMPSPDSASDSTTLDHVVGRPTGYEYPTVQLAKVGESAKTHVCTEGYVRISRAETDGDYHIGLAASSGGRVLVVAEIIPTLVPVKPQIRCDGCTLTASELGRPQVGSHIRVCGITRWDKQHKWPEIHPVEAWDYSYRIEHR